MRWPCWRPGRGPAFLVAQLDAHAAGQVLDGLGEAQVVDLADERDDVAALAAPEAVEEPLAGADLERRRLLVVEGAQPLHVAAARGAQLHPLADDLLDAGPVAHREDVLADDPTGHAAESTEPVDARSRPVHAPRAGQMIKEHRAPVWDGRIRGRTP